MTQVILGLNDPPVKLCELDLSGIPSDQEGLSFFNLSGYGIIAAYLGPNLNWHIGAWDVKSGEFILSGGYQALSDLPFGFYNLCTYGPYKFEYWPGIYGTDLFFVTDGSTSGFFIPKPSPIFAAILQTLLGIFAKIVNLISAIGQRSYLIPIDILAVTLNNDVYTNSVVFGNYSKLFSTISNYEDNYAALYNGTTQQLYFINKNGIVTITSPSTPKQYQDETGLYVYGTPNETDGQMTQIVNGEIVKQYTNPDIFGQTYYGNANNIMVFVDISKILLVDTDGNIYPTTGLPDLEAGGACVGAGSGLVFFSNHHISYPADRDIIITKYAFENGLWVKGASSAPIFVPANTQDQMLYLRDGSSLLALGYTLNPPYSLRLYLLAGPYTPYTLPVISGVNLHLNPLCPPCTDEEIF